MAEVRIEFPKLSEEQMEHLFKAEKQLLKAGVSFDTGYVFVKKRRDWEFDWSLKGAKVILKKENKIEAEKEG